MRNGKVALVTGSSTGIGAATAKALAKDGYDVAVHYNSSEEDGKKVLEAVQACGVKGCLLHGDTADKKVPERLVKETVEKLGRLDVMVNNAGITIFEDTLEITPEVMDKLYNLNFRGMILGASAAAKYMIANGVKGTIIFNTSVRAFAPHSDDGIYGGLKAGLNRFIRSMAVDVGRYGIRVNGFSPGITNVMCPDPSDEKASPFYAYTHKFVPLRRNGYAEDMGNVVSFLASDKASYITGEVIRVDGGLSIVGAPEHMPGLYNAFDVTDITDTDPDLKNFYDSVEEHRKTLKKNNK